MCVCLFRFPAVCPICFPEALEMHDFPLPQKFNGFADVRVLNQAEDIVVGSACLLLCDTFINTNNEGG